MSVALLLLAVVVVAVVVGALLVATVHDHRDGRTASPADAPTAAPAAPAAIWGAALIAADSDGQEGTLELRTDGLSFYPVGHHDAARPAAAPVAIERSALQGISVATDPCAPSAPAMQRPGCIMIHTTTGDHRFTVDQPEIKAAEFSRLYAVPRRLA